jgi:hypothetical protein
MAKDIYQVNIGAPKAWKLDSALINFGDHNQQLLATSCSITYNRPMATYFPINDDTRVIVAGTPTGTLQIGAIVGPYGDLKAFLDAFADVCNIATNVITITPGGVEACEDSDVKNVKFKLTGCLLNQLSLNVVNENGLGMVTSGLNLTFLGLEVDNTK